MNNPEARQTKSEGQSQELQSETGKHLRRSPWKGSWEALKHVWKTFRSGEIRLRRMDKVTDFLLVVVILASLASFAYPQQNKLMSLVCDLSFAVAVIIYIMRRLGILTSLSPRQTVIIAQLMFGFAMLCGHIVANLTVYLFALRFNSLVGP